MNAVTWILIGIIVVMHIVVAQLAMRKQIAIHGKMADDNDSGKLQIDTVPADPNHSDWAAFKDITSESVRWPIRVRGVALAWLGCFIFVTLVLLLGEQSVPEWLVVLKVYGLSCPVSLLYVWFQHRTDEVPIFGLRGRGGRPVE